MRAAIFQPHLFVMRCFLMPSSTLSHLSVEKILYRGCGGSQRRCIALRLRFRQTHADCRRGLDVNAMLRLLLARIWPYVDRL